MANITLDFLHNYHTGERRESDPANAYQYDEGHVLEAVLPEVITSAEIHYWIRGMEEAEAYTPTSITPNEGNSCTILGNIPNSYFETNGELRIYIVVTDGTASITTYEGKLHICQRSMPDDYVDDDPENEAVRVITEARAAAATATEKAGEAAESAEQAQEVLDSIPADYSQLSEDVNDLKEDFLNTLVTDTATGAIASFSDGADNVPVKSLTVAVEPVQSGTGDPSPDNVRPISGHTQVVVTRCGKNLADFTNGYTISGTGLPSSYAKRSATLTPIPIAEGKAYRFLCTGTHVCAIYSVLDAENNLVRRVTGVDSGTVLNTSDGAYLYVCGYDTSDTATVTADENTLMVVFDTETDTAYEPYNGQTYTIDLDGTRYGGTLNVETGVLTVDRVGAVLNDPDKWGVSPGTTTTYQYDIAFTNRKLYANSFTGLSCSMMPVNSHTVRYTARWIGANDPTFGIAFDGENPELTLAQIKALAANGDISIAYDIEPQTIQLTAQEVRTLLGTNNIWSDAGTVDVEYRADTKLYIEKLTAPTEDDMIADHAISKNSFFMVGNTLYRATTAIASGATITVGTNATKLSLSDALNALA